MKIGVGTVWAGLAAALLLSSAALADSTNNTLPDSQTIRALMQGVTFAKEPVTSGPVVPEYAPNFRLAVYFRAKMLDIPATGGAIAGKIVVQGIPASYAIPDGAYYLWIGRANGGLQAGLATMEDAIKTELCVEEIAESSNLLTNTLASSIGPTPCDRLRMVQVPGRLPPGAKFPPPKPPPTQKRTIQDICYTENGSKSPVTKYRKGVVYVPDS